MFCLAVALCALPLLASSQTVVNGQIFTSGLSIVDAPAVNSVYHGGSNMPIAIDVSGNGRLQAAASKPGSGLDTRFDSLELYLVSSQQNLNLTVSSGTGLLTQEPGSTVKHLDFALPSCIPAGNYNLTVYEGSHIDSDAHFSITSLPLQVENAAVSGQCSGNQLEQQPQASSAPQRSPWLNENGTVVTYPTNGASGSTTGAAIMITQACMIAVLLMVFL